MKKLLGFIGTAAVMASLAIAGCSGINDPVQPESSAIDNTQSSAAAAALGKAAAGTGRIDVLIGFTRTPGVFEHGIVRAAGGKLKYSYSIIPAVAASIPAQAITALQNNPNITVIEPDIEVYAIDAELDNSWGVKHIRAATVQDNGNKGAGVKVAVIDAGIDYNHPDLAANYAGGYDYVNNDDDPMDDNGHGTHVSGTIGAVDDDNGVVGVAPLCRLYGLKVLNASGSGSFSAVIAALQWCVDNGIAITNNSYGSSTDPGTLVHQAFDNSYAAGVLHIGAAGNSGRINGKGNTVGFPGQYASVVAVAAIDKSNLRASFSSTGDAVELAAPGVAVTSTTPGGGYATWSGTSMASPHVAGLAALIAAAGVTTPDNIRTRLQAGAIDLGDSGRDPWYGYGLIDAVNSVPAGPVNGAPVVTITTPENGALFSPGSGITFSATATDAEDGELSENIEWFSSIDGILGTGASIVALLSDGNHTVTARVTDNQGATGSASVAITVGNPPPQASLAIVSQIGYALTSRDKDLLVKVYVNDDLGSNVVGASVSMQLMNKTSGTLWSATGSTNADGVLILKLRNAPKGCYSTTIQSVTASGLTWDGVTPVNSFGKGVTDCQ